MSQLTHNCKPKLLNVAEMFDGISDKYDQLNHIMTLGMDHIWRKKLIQQILPVEGKKILDIATGTGDLAFRLLEYQPESIIGIDISSGMVNHCKHKIKKYNAEKIIQCFQADAMQLPFENNSFDIVCIAFGIRNFPDTQKAISEIRRVLKPDGKFVALEFLRSKLIEKNKLFRIYMKSIVPFMGRKLSKHPWAYEYLYNSMQSYLSPEEFSLLLQQSGFSEITIHSTGQGIAHIIKANCNIGSSL